MIQATCLVCGKSKEILPSREKTFRYCSYECAGKSRIGKVGELHHRWQGGEREKVCIGCGVEFKIRKNQPITTFKTQKYCSKPCADKHVVSKTGKEHHRYREDARRRNRSGGHAKWARAVISRDMATCRHCGAKDIELHAHHLLSYQNHPELRTDVSNGITLCCHCHWNVHTASNENGVNSVDTLRGNTEPSSNRKILEGVTTRGRAYRRVATNCEWCGIFISKRLSDTTGKKHLFCSSHCSGKFAKRPKAVISSTSALRESEDIV